MTQQIECFTAYWNDKTKKSTIKTTPEFKANPIMMYHALSEILEDLNEVGKKNFKKAEKAGLDVHVGCRSWPNCDMYPETCTAFDFEEERDFYEYDEPTIVHKEFCTLNESDLHTISMQAIWALQAAHKSSETPVTLDIYRFTVAQAIQDALIRRNK